MPFLKKRKSKEKHTETLKSERTDSIAMNQLLDFLGVDRELRGSALSEATYFACIKVLSEAVGKLPLKVFQRNADNGVITARGHPLYSILNNRPNRYMTSTTFWSTVEFNRNHYGNAFALIIGAGADTTLWILPSESVSVWYDNGCLLSNIPDIYYIYSVGGKRYSFGSEEILHFRSSNTRDGIMGVSVREQLAGTIDGNRKAQKMLNRMYDSGFTAKAVLQYTGNLSDANAEAFTKGIEAYTKGEMKDRGIENIIPIPIGATLQPLNVKLADNQFVEVKQYSALQIASAFGIKPNQIGDYTKSSYASAEAQQLSFYVDTLLYIIKQYEEEITYKLFSSEEMIKGYHAKFNIYAILRADMKTQIDMLSTAVNGFIYTPNEARAMLDKPAKPGGDKLVGNGTAIPIEDVGKQYTEKDGETNG